MFWLIFVPAERKAVKAANWAKIEKKIVRAILKKKIFLDELTI